MPLREPPPQVPGSAGGWVAYAAPVRLGPRVCGDGVPAIANFSSSLKSFLRFPFSEKIGFGETPKPTPRRVRYPEPKFCERALNFRVEHDASSIKNVISSIESQHSVT
jgi:hypothetical protein